MSPQAFLRMLARERVSLLVLRHTAFDGKCMTRSLAAAEVRAEQLLTGFRIHGAADGSGEAAEDCIWKPMLEAHWRDAAATPATVYVACEALNAESGLHMPTDARSMCRRAEAVARASGVLAERGIGARARCYLFDNVWFDCGTNFAKFHLDSREGEWNRGAEDPNNLGHAIRASAGRTAEPPADATAHIRDEIAAAARQSGVAVLSHGHGPDTAQAEFEIAATTLTKLADQLSWFKSLCRQIGARHGKAVTFMPQPLMDGSGSGLTITLAMPPRRTSGRKVAGKRGRTGDRPRRWAAEWAAERIGGRLTALCALANPTTNSYKRLYGMKGAPIVVHRDSLELRFPDMSCNPYAALAGVAMAASDSPEYADPPLDATREVLAANLTHAMAALLSQDGFLTRDGVFFADVLEGWARRKLLEECRRLRTAPHPLEFIWHFGA